MVHHWRVIGLVELVLYFVLGLISIYPAYNLITRKSKFWSFFIRFYLLIVVRIAGSILLTIYAFGAGNTDVLTAAIVFSSISLGFINMTLIFLLKFVEIFHNPEFKSEGKGYLDLIMPKAFIKRLLNANYRRPFIWLEISQKLVLLGIILGAISGGVKVSAMAALQKASSILYLCAIVVTTFCVYQTYSDSQDYMVAAKRLKTRLLISVCCAIPVVFVRTIAGILGAFASRDQWGLNDYTIYMGKWQYYSFLTFLQEYLTVIIFVAAGWIVKNAEDHRVATASVSQKDKFEEEGV